MSENIDFIYGPLKSIGTSRRINYHLLCTEDIFVWNQNIMRKEIKGLAFVPWYLHLNILNNRM